MRELLGLINRKRLDEVIVAMNFTFGQIQACKERAHPEFLFRGDTDGTHEVPEEIDLDEVKRWIAMLFNLMGRLSVRDQQRAFSIRNLPPAVKVLLWCLLGLFCYAMYSFVLLKIHG